VSNHHNTIDTYSPLEEVATLYIDNTRVRLYINHDYCLIAEYFSDEEIDLALDKEDSMLTYTRDEKYAKLFDTQILPYLSLNDRNEVIFSQYMKGWNE
jgi:hypothetical protein